MSFHLHGDNDGQYMRKLKSFLDFLFKVNFSNNIYVSLEVGRLEETYSKYKVYLGKGNNSLLIKSLLKRRFWWEITDHIDSPDILFYWSQNIIDKTHDRQGTASRPPLPTPTSSKARPSEESFELNRKLMPAEKSVSVEKYILRDGYSLPFD